VTQRADSRQQAAASEPPALVPRPVSIPSPPAPPSYTPTESVLQRLLVLREPGKHQLAWPDCAKALGMAERTLSRWRWLLAAELRAIGWGWIEIASHPAVDRNKDTIRKECVRAKLPSGLSFTEHVEQYQAAQQERASELQAQRGQAAAERIYCIGQQALDVLEQLQTLVVDYVAHPPDVFNPAGQPLLAKETVKQLLIAFPGQDLPEKSLEPKPRITAPFARYLTKLQTELLHGIAVAESVLVAHKPAADEADSDFPDMAESDILAARERGERLIAELKSYEGAA
jgi:hypothetical protein